MQKFRKLDIFKKVPKDLSEGTDLGGLISIIAALLMVYFIVNQIITFVSPPNYANISLDEPLTRKQLTVNLHIEFPRFPCELLSLDTQDTMMSHEANIKQIKKYRQDSQGRLIDKDDFQLLREPDVSKQYKMAEQAFQKGYGCRVKGSFRVKEVPGNFHISSHSYNIHYIRLSKNNIIKTLDVSHKIHYLYFGQFSNIRNVVMKHPGSQLTALNGHHRLYNMTLPYLYTSHYHLDIVPTVYTGLLDTVETYQYTYMHNTFNVNHMPSLYFNYHIGGTKVTIAPPSWRFQSFILNLCAIVGGTYALSHFLYNTLFAILGGKINYQELGH